MSSSNWVVDDVCSVSFEEGLVLSLGGSLGWWLGCCFFFLICLHFCFYTDSMDLMVWCRYGSYLGGCLGSSMKKRIMLN